MTTPAISQLCRSAHTAQLGNFLQDRHQHLDSVTLPIALVDICRGDHVAALVLGSVLDSLRDGPLTYREGDPAPWVPASWDQWYRRLRLNRRRGNRVLAVLTNLQLLRVVNQGVGGRGKGGVRRVLCVQLVHENFLAQWHNLALGHAPLYLEEDPD